MKEDVSFLREEPADAYEVPIPEAPSLVKLCSKCTEKRLGPEWYRAPCLLLGIFRGNCSDCTCNIGEDFHIPYFVQWKSFFGQTDLKVTL